MSISATIFGRLTGDPEQRTPQNGGNPYVTFSIASNTGRKDNNGNNIAQFINISAFGKRGETIMQYFKKASRIAVHVSNLELRTWTGQQDGQAHGNLNAVLEGFDFVDSAAESNNQPPAHTAPPRANAGYAPAQSYSAPPTTPAAPPVPNYAAPPTAPAYASAPAAPPAYSAAPAAGSTPWS